MISQEATPVVLKFGGTSVRDAAAMRRVVEIVERERGRRPVVVTSACAGVTDALLECARLCGQMDAHAAMTIVRSLRDRHMEILSQIDAPSELARRDELVALLDELERLVLGVVLLGELTARTTDTFASFGERLSSVLLTSAFCSAGWNATLVDSRAFIKTDAAHGCARPLMEEIDRCAKSELLPLLSRHEVVIAQGFIGSTLDGVTTTIGRGGSDYTGALVGAAIDAREIQIWTDVSGILTADPRLVPDARVVPEVTFTEARELAYFGAKVIHPDTIVPAVQRSIPVVIKNSMRPDDAGTTILSDGSPVSPGVHSVTLKRGMLALRLSARQAGAETPPDVQHLFERHEVPVHAALYAESRALLVVEASKYNDILHSAVESACRVEVGSEMTLVAMIGSELRETSGVLTGPLSSIEHIPLSMISAGTSDHVALVGVANEHANDCLIAVHGAMSGATKLREQSI